MKKKPQRPQSVPAFIKKVPKTYWLTLLALLLLVVVILFYSHKDKSAHETTNKPGDSTQQHITDTTDASTPAPQKPGSPAPGPSKTPTAQAQPPSRPKGLPGECGPAVPRTSSDTVYCDLSVSVDKIPAEIRMLTPKGEPGVTVTCSAGAICDAARIGQFTTHTFDDIFYVNVRSAGTVEIAMPKIRRSYPSSNSAMVFTSSYWVYGPVDGDRCCGEPAPYIFDIYNGYSESKL